jgi:hypothetical protein
MVIVTPSQLGSNIGEVIGTSAAMSKRVRRIDEGEERKES